MPVGQRHITGRTEQRSWKENAIDHYAETITYTITTTPELQKAGLAVLGPFSIRMVMQNDPAVGHWQVQSDPLTGAMPGLASGEEVAIQNQLTAFGSAHEGEMQAGIASAIAQAFNMKEAAMAAAGGLARDPKVPFVSFKRSANLAFYTKVQPSQSMSPTQMLDYCRSLKTPGYGPWRMATIDDLKALLDQFPFGRLVDLPDGRLLRDLGRRPEGQDVAFIFSSTIEDRSNEYAIGTAPPELNGGAIMGFRVLSDGEVQPFPFGGQGADTLSQLMDTQINFQNGYADGRVACVAKLR
jgi:hypothetical protein